MGHCRKDPKGVIRFKSISRIPLLASTLVLVPLCVLAFAACGDGGEGGEPIRVGVILSEMCPDLNVRLWAKEIKRGLEIALADHAVPIELIYRDDHGDPTYSERYVNELASNAGVQVIIGPLTSKCCLAAARWAEKNRVPLVVPAGTHEEITKSRDWVFRMCFTDPQQGAEMALFARQELGRSRALILKEVTSDYALGLAESFTRSFIQNGGRIVKEVTYRSGMIDTGTVKDWLAGEPFDVIYLPAYPSEVVDFTRAASVVLDGRDVVLLGSDGWETTDRDETAGWPGKLYFTAHFTTSSKFIADVVNPAIRSFIRGYEHRYQTEPGSFAALGYDTGCLIAEVIRKGARTCDDFRRHIRDLQFEFEGVTGAFSKPADSDLPIKDILVLEDSGPAWEYCMLLGKSPGMGER